MSHLILSGKFCPYCNCETSLVKGDLIYPRHAVENPNAPFLKKFYYQCVQNSDHYVGTYSDNITSLGRIADGELRIWKQKGHSIFDPLWKEKLYFSSQQSAYDWLSKKMEKPLSETHFGMFTIDECQKAILFCESLILKKS